MGLERWARLVRATRLPQGLVRLRSRAFEVDLVVDVQAYKDMLSEERRAKVEGEKVGEVGGGLRGWLEGGRKND